MNLAKAYNGEKAVFDSKVSKFRVFGNNMNDGTARSILDGDTVLAKSIFQRAELGRLTFNEFNVWIVLHKWTAVPEIREIFNGSDGQLILKAWGKDVSDIECGVSDIHGLWGIVEIRRKISTVHLEKKRLF